MPDTQAQNRAPLRAHWKIAVFGLVVILTLLGLGALATAHSVLARQAEATARRGAQLSSLHATPAYAHFARVLGMDVARREIYIENTLTGPAYWTLSLDEFFETWTHPETSSSLVPDPARAKDVNRWVVSIDRAASAA